jgi:hypothetical protein
MPRTRARRVGSVEAWLGWTLDAAPALCRRATLSGARSDLRPMLWFRGAPVEQIRVPIGQIAPVLPLAVIVAEDARFCGPFWHDWQGIKEAIGDAYEGDKLRGGSSILWQGRSYVRKLLEIPTRTTGKLQRQSQRSAWRQTGELDQRLAPIS